MDRRVKSEFVMPPILSRPDAERVVRRRTRRDPKPRFKADCPQELDVINGCPAVAVPADHLAWSVQAEVAKLDVSALEAKYSSLGRYGYHPRYPSDVGRLDGNLTLCRAFERESRKCARAQLEGDAPTAIARIYYVDAATSEGNLATNAEHLDQAAMRAARYSRRSVARWRITRR